VKFHDRPSLFFGFVVFVVYAFVEGTVHLDNIDRGLLVFGEELGLFCVFREVGHDHSAADPEFVDGLGHSAYFLFIVACVDQRSVDQLSTLVFDQEFRKFILT